MSNELASRKSGYSGGVGELVEVATQTRQIKELGGTLIASGLLPDAIKKPEAAVAVMLKGAELGMSAMYALSHIAIISGKPAMSAEAMQALVQRSGHVIRLIENSSERCVVEGVRRDDPNHRTRIEWTMEDAKAAKLAGKDVWKSYPRAMLRSRAVSELCRAMFADVLSGVSYVPEELGAVVNEEGEVIESPDSTDTTDSDSGDAEDVEEAEVVEDDLEQDTGEHDRLMNLVAEKMDEFPEGEAPDANTVYSFANEGIDSARRTLAKLNRDLEKSLDNSREPAERSEKAAS